MRGWLAVPGLVALALGLAGCAALAPVPVDDPVPAETPVAVPAAAPEPATLLRGGTVLPATGRRLDGADVLIVGEEIRAVGVGLEAPPDARVIELAGRWVTPGLIDAHSHIGVYPAPRVPANRDGNEATSPSTAHVRAAESFWPQDPSLRRAVAGGVTTIHVLPGSANVVGGQGVTLRLLPALSARAMRLPRAPGTMKMACGENPKFVYGERKGIAPATRMGEVAMLRQKLAEARAYKRGSNGPDLEKEALKRALRGELLIQNHCYRADEMLLRLELFAEFGTAPRAFHHAVEAYKIRDVLAGAGVGVATWTDWWGRKLEMYDTVPAAVALLHKAGVRVAVHSDSAYDIQRLNQEAAKAMAAGQRAGIPVGRADAIRWITANPAWLLGIEKRTGMLEAGKLADVTVWSGDPFSVYTKADLVFIGGETVYDRADPDSYPRSDYELGLGELP